jgi:UDP-GlcNAc:undecaprenyl-phosphate GlcNAc-1-phosphate transferase
MALSIPLLDVVLSVMRRFLRNRPIFTADRSHIHHRLIDRGLTPRRAVLLVYAVSGFAALCALVQSFTGQLYMSLLVVVLFCGLAWMGVDYLSYSEFVLAGRLFRAGEFQRAVNTQLMLDNFASALDAAADVPACWAAIRAHYRNFGFCGVRMRIDGVSYQDGDAAREVAARWTATIPLSAEDFIELAREFESNAPSAAVGSTADLLRSAVARHLPAARSAGRS